MHPFPRSLLIPAVLAGAVLTGACAVDNGDAGEAPDAASPVSTTEVAIVDNDFEPAAIAIEPGDTVTWNWEGDSEHDVSGDGFRSDVQRSGTFTHTFSEAGRFSYVCRLHAGMEGVVVVGRA